MNDTGNSFVTLKDHKKHFMNHPTARLTFHLRTKEEG